MRSLAALLFTLTVIATLAFYVIENLNRSMGIYFPFNAGVAVWSDTGGIWRMSAPFPTRATTLDLTTGSRQKFVASHEYLQLRDSHDVGYETRPVASGRDGYELVSREGTSPDTTVVCRLPTYIGFDLLVADRYLIELEQGKITALDIEQSRGGQASISSIEEPELDSNGMRPIVLPGTSIFALTCVAKWSPKVNVYSFNSTGITELASWNVSAAAPKMVARDKEILTIAPGGQAVEVRTLNGWNEPQLQSAPMEVIAQWGAMETGLGVLTIQDPQTAQHQTYRVKDFERIEQLDGLSRIPSWMVRDDVPRYTFFTSSVARTDLTVYDGMQEKIVLRMPFPSGVGTISQIGPTQLAITNLNYGGMVRVVDIPSGRIVATYYPSFWPNLGAIVLTASLIAWCAAWLWCSARFRWPLAIDWVVIGSIVVVPTLYRMVRFDMWSLHWRFSVCLIQAAVATGFFAISSYVLYGRARWPYRLLLWLAYLTLLTSALILLEYGFSGPWLEFPGQAWWHFMLLGLVTVAAGVMLKPVLAGVVCGYSPALPGSIRNTRIIDWFAFTTGLAMLLGILVALNSNLEHEVSNLKTSIGEGLMKSLVPVALLTLQVVLVQFVASLLFLTKRTALNRIGLILGVAASVVLVTEWILALRYEWLPPQIYAWVIYLRMLSLVYLLGGAWLWRQRKAGGASAVMMAQTNQF